MGRPTPGTVTYIASQLPTIVHSTTPPSISACTANSTTAGTTTAIGSGPFPNEIGLKLNQFMANTAASFAYGGGNGLVEGCTGATAASLALPVAAGQANIMGAVPYPGGTVVCPDNTTLGFIWLNQNGTLTANASTTPPSSNCCYIMNFTTLSGAVTNVDYTGVLYCSNGNLVRTTGDIGAPSDSPPANTSFFTETTTGLYWWSGFSYFALDNLLAGSLNYKAALSGTFTMTLLHNKCNFQFSATGGDQIVLLPLASALPPGWAATWLNIGSANNIVIKDSTGTTTYCTIASGDGVGVSTYLNTSNVVVFPGATWTAATPTYWTPGIPIS